MRRPPSILDQPTPAGRIGRWAALLLIGVVFVSPLVWIVSAASTPESEIVGGRGGLLPPMPDANGTPRSAFTPGYWRDVASTAADNAVDAWTSPLADFPLFLHNSLYVALLSVIGMTFVSAVVAFGLARLQWRGRNAVFVTVLAALMIPFPVVMAPLYLIFRSIGWVGSFKPLWVPAWFGGAFSIFLLRQFFLTIPRRLDEAAMIDGCSHWGVFTRIILPLSKPALVTVALFQFIASWNDFVGPLIFLNHQDTFTLSLGLFMYQSQQGATPWNLVMAATVLTVLPVAAIFLIAQRAFVSGAAGGGVKG